MQGGDNIEDNAKVNDARTTKMSNSGRTFMVIDPGSSWTVWTMTPMSSVAENSPMWTNRAERWSAISSIDVPNPAASNAAPSKPYGVEKPATVLHSNPCIICIGYEAHGRRITPPAARVKTIWPVRRFRGEMVKVVMILQGKR